MSIISLIKFLTVEFLGLVIGVVATGFVIAFVLRTVQSRKRAVGYAGGIVALFFAFALSGGIPGTMPHGLLLRTMGPGAGPFIAFGDLTKFFYRVPRTEFVADIARDPNDVSPLGARSEEQHVKIELTTKEVIGTTADGVEFSYWTFNDTVPGPFLRVREGDTIELTLKNDPLSVHYHNIDLHAVTGPGGGATVTNVAPGESKTLTFKALNPGLYVYHCAHPNVATHMAHGMYGLILVEPKEGLPPVDKEFYVMQGELYGTGEVGAKGLQVFDAKKMLDGKPEYVVFNGRVGALNGKMQARVGDRVRLFIGNGGVNMISSFHVIGEIFDDVYPEGAIGSDTHKNIQTTLVPAGGAAIAEFDLQVPGNFIFVDHALARLDRGAWGVLKVTGPDDSSIFQGVADHEHSSHGH